MSQTNSIQNDENAYDLTVIVVNYNGMAILNRCLQAITSTADGLKVQTILVDNGSHDGSQFLPCCYEENIEVIRLNKNVGFSRANNIGVNAARGRYFLLLNTDCFVQPGLYRTLIRCLDTHHDAAVVGPRLLNSDGTLQPSCHNFPSPIVFLLEQSSFWKLLRRLPGNWGSFLQIASKHTHPGVVDWVSGACMLVRPEAFGEVGGFDNGFFFYWEEADLCKRLGENGWKTRVEPQAKAVHLGGGSTGDGRMLLRFFTSLYRFYAKHYSRRQSIGLRATVRLLALLKATKFLFSALTGDSHEANIAQARIWASVARL